MGQRHLDPERNLPFEPLPEQACELGGLKMLPPSQRIPRGEREVGEVVVYKHRYHLCVG